MKTTYDIKDDLAQRHSRVAITLSASNLDNFIVR